MASAGGQDMFEAMKTLVSLARTETFDPSTISAYRALQMATIEGAEALMLDKQIGSLEKGKMADVICVDVATLFHSPALDTIATLVFAGSSRDVKHVILKGEKAVVNHTLTLADEKTLVEKIERRAAAALERSLAQSHAKG
jgi:5-methylthioadenosine/S-adenosylhomocysteine deaminase